MEHDASCNYTSFLEEETAYDLSASHSSSLPCSFSSFFKKIKLNRKRCFRCASAYAVIFISFLCLVAFVSFFMYMHYNSSYLSNDEMYEYATLAPVYPFERKVDIEGVDFDKKIWLWKENNFKREFEKFKKKFSKTYASKNEHENRYQIFKKNLYYIHTHNEQDYSYELKMNAFGDLTNDEFKSHFVSFKKQNSILSMGTAAELLNVSDDELPLSVDWKARKCVTEVKNQRQCGSCWAFSSIGSIEGAVCAKSGKLYDLSEQQLVDCAKSEGNEGCDGGDMDAAFKYVMHNHGICTEHDYPYLAKENKCSAKKCRNAVSIQGFKDIPHKSEKALKAALHKYGPIAVAVEADKLAFQFYHKGIFHAECGDNLNHGVLLVAYGRYLSKKNEHLHKNSTEDINDDENKKYDFFEIKNSWGTEWGENGFMRLAMHKGEEGECGILLEGSFPIV